MYMSFKICCNMFANYADHKWITTCATFGYLGPVHLVEDRLFRYNILSHNITNEIEYNGQTHEHCECDNSTNTTTTRRRPVCHHQIVTPIFSLHIHVTMPK